jgi:hypothetical protein
VRRQVGPRPCSVECCWTGLGRRAVLPRRSPTTFKTTVFSQRSCGWFDASLRGAAPERQTPSIGFCRTRHQQDCHLDIRVLTPSFVFTMQIHRHLREMTASATCGRPQGHIYGAPHRAIEPYGSWPVDLASPLLPATVIERAAWRLKCSVAAKSRAAPDAGTGSRPIGRG